MIICELDLEYWIQFGPRSQAYLPLYVWDCSFCHFRQFCSSEHFESSHHGALEYHRMLVFFQRNRIYSVLSVLLINITTVGQPGKCCCEWRTRYHFFFSRWNWHKQYFIDIQVGLSFWSFKITKLTSFKSLYLCFLPYAFILDSFSTSFMFRESSNKGGTIFWEKHSV